MGQRHSAAKNYFKWQIVQVFTFRCQNITFSRNLNTYQRYTVIAVATARNKPHIDPFYVGQFELSTPAVEIL